MPRCGEQGERLAGKSEVGSQWKNLQNILKAESVMQLETDSHCTCIKRQIYIAVTILILSLPNSMTLSVFDCVGLTAK